MSQSNLKKVFSKLRIEVGPRRRMRNPLGPEGRLMKMRKTVTALVKHERIELFYHRGDESRGYVERLISDAIRYGEYHKETMELASYWLLEKQLVHKLFKVLVPRYQDCKYSYTRMLRTPREYPGQGREKCVLELRGNIYPSLTRKSHSNCNLLHNKLLDEMRLEYEQEQEKEKEAISAGGTKHLTGEESDEDSEESSDSDNDDRGSSTDGRTKENPSSSDSNTANEGRRT